MEKLIVTEVGNDELGNLRFRIDRQPSDIELGCGLVWEDEETGMSILSDDGPAFIGQRTLYIQGLESHRNSNLLSVPKTDVSAFLKTIENCNKHRENLISEKKESKDKQIEKLIVEEVTPDAGVRRWKIANQPSDIVRCCGQVWEDEETGISLISSKSPEFIYESNIFCIRGFNEERDTDYFKVPEDHVQNFLKTIENFNKHRENLKSQEKETMEKLVVEEMPSGFEPLHQFRIVSQPSDIILGEGEIWADEETGFSIRSGSSPEYAQAHSWIYIHGLDAHLNSNLLSVPHTDVSAFLKTIENYNRYRVDRNIIMTAVQKRIQKERRQMKEESKDQLSQHLKDTSYFRQLVFREMQESPEGKFFKCTQLPATIVRGCGLVWADKETGFDILSWDKPEFLQVIAKASVYVWGRDKEEDGKVIFVCNNLLDLFQKTIANYNESLRKQKPTKKSVEVVDDSFSRDIENLQKVQEKSKMSEQVKQEEKQVQNELLGSVSQTIVFDSESIQKIIVKYVRENYCSKVKFYCMEVVSANRDVVVTVHL